MKFLLSLLIIIFFSGLTFSQDYTIRGFITDKENGEPVAFQNIRLLNKSDSSLVQGAATDLNGFFTIPKVNRGEYILSVSNQAYNNFFKLITIEGADLILKFDVEIEKLSDIKQLEDVDVSAVGIQKRTEVLMSTISMNQKELERIPSVGAENDIVGALSVTPGVVTTGDQGGQLYVRGGTPIQNKILLDGMTIYQPFHTIGFFSVFETELIRNADIYTGGFDARYGGRISSIMDITYRDGDRTKFGGRVSVSPFLAKVVLEGPMSKKLESGKANASYVFTAKQSLLNYTSKDLYPRVNNGEGLPFDFTDLYGKITLNSDGGSKISFFGFHNRDSVNYSGIANLNWKASGGGVNFLLVPSSSPIFIRGHINGSNYSTTFDEEGSEPRTSTIGGAELGFDFTYFLKNQSEFNYGININIFKTDFFTKNELQQKIEISQDNTEIGAYVNYRLVKNRWVIQPSFRVQAYPSLSTVSPEPRIGLKYNASENLRFKASGGRFSQNFTSASSDKDVVNLFNGLLSAPTNVQEKFTNEFGKEKEVKNGIQYAYHAIIGTEYDFNKFFTANIEGYYKYFSQLSNINQRKYFDDTPQFSQIDDVFKKDFIIESGQSYGMDILLKFQKNRFFLWTTYSLAKSTRWDGFEEYAPVFDRRHNVNMVGTYIFGKNKDLELNVRWNLGSGLPFTPTAGNYQNEPFSGGITTDYTTSNPTSITTKLGTFNSERLPYYHRLDITVKKQFKFKNETTLELIGSVTNAYDRRNIFYINRVTNETIYQFPILPSIGVNYKF